MSNTNITVSESSTPFDDAFKTLLERLPFLMVPVINEIFGTSYDTSSNKVSVRNNEHHTFRGKIIQDSRILVADSAFLTECESIYDKSITKEKPVLLPSVLLHAI